MDFLDKFAIGDDVTIYNVLGPIMLMIMVFGVVLFHGARNRRPMRSGSFASRLRAAVDAGYLSKEEGAEIIAMHRPRR